MEKEVAKSSGASAGKNKLNTAKIIGSFIILTATLSTAWAAYAIFHHSIRSL